MVGKKFKPDLRHLAQDKTFDPMSYDGKTPRCICGYDLVKEDDVRYRCTGGNHVFELKEGEDVAYDKFGNLLFKIPEDLNGSN